MGEDEKTPTGGLVPWTGPSTRTSCLWSSGDGPDVCRGVEGRFRTLRERPGPNPCSQEDLSHWNPLWKGKRFSDTKR